MPAPRGESSRPFAAGPPEMERLARSCGLTLAQLPRCSSATISLTGPQLARSAIGRRVAWRCLGVTVSFLKLIVPEKEEAMSQTSLAPFESTLQTTNIWLNDIRERLGWTEDHHRG